MLYEAREAELREQLTRLESAEEKGKIEVAKKMIQQGVEMKFIVEVTGFTEEEIVNITNIDT